MSAFANPLNNLANLAATISIFTVLRDHINDNGVRGAIAYGVAPFAVESIKILHRRTTRQKVSP